MTVGDNSSFEKLLLDADLCFESYLSLEHTLEENIRESVLGKLLLTRNRHGACCHLHLAVFTFTPVL